MKPTASFGLTADDLELRKGSIGASTTRLIVNGEDDELQELYALHRAQLTGEPIELDDLADEIYPQFGHYVEGFTAHWFERRTGLEISRRGEHVTSPDLPGLHVTLDGFLTELLPSRYENKPSDFDFTWTCPQPAAPVQAVFEMKFRNGNRFDPYQQVEKFLPQLHQGMALTGAKYAVLATLTSDLKLYAVVAPFDRFYWAEVRTRITAFADAVRSGTPLLKLPSLKAPLERVDVVAKTVDMSAHPQHANLWNAFAVEVLKNAPTDDETAKVRRHDKSKDAMKKLITKDVGVAFGGGILFRRDKGGSLRMEIDEAALEAARKDAVARAAAGVAAA